ncbi:hypothetical protein [Achromobacter piechaudii]|uniref:FMN-binding domain-containing protein n=1 Tax=Achromobacter piechaudii TaxID=72556 RepID=A0ABM8L2U2_9BURK|nr:hypothetical protein [Achromobacter piechaudii]CAB3729099.1 hypothetical protein LMG1873_04643 [Achromobacter piechaudii]
MQRKPYQVVMRRTETRISEQTVTVHAESEADARVLAKYEETPSYLWQDEVRTATVDIATIKGANDPATHYGNLAAQVAHQVAAGDARN